MSPCSIGRQAGSLWRISPRRDADFGMAIVPGLYPVDRRPGSPLSLPAGLAPPWRSRRGRLNGRCVGFCGANLTLQSSDWYVTDGGPSSGVPVIAPRARRAAADRFSPPDDLGKLRGRTLLQGHVMGGEAWRALRPKLNAPRGWPGGAADARSAFKPLSLRKRPASRCCVCRYP